MVPSEVIKSVRRWLPRTGGVGAFLFAGLLLAIAVLVRLQLDAITDQPLPPYITFYPAIVISAFMGGIRVGLFAMAASAFIAWVLWIAPASGGPVSPVRILTAIVYLFTGTITVLTSGLARLLMDDAATAEAERAQAARESVHRIKNLLAVIQSISRKVSLSSSDVAAYRDRLSARLGALATAQDILLKREWTDVQLRDLVRSTLGAFMPNPRLQVSTDADCIVPKRVVTQLSMALYELATNSMKYGALSSDNGLVRLQSQVAGGRCSLEWREIGMAHVAVGESAGLGSTLIRSALSAIGDGVVSYEVSPQAVTCLFDWPAAD
jgi:two-component sensor histidine kinase